MSPGGESGSAPPRPPEHLLQNSPAQENGLKRVLELLHRLEAAKIHFRLARNQEDAISIEVAVPGLRWKIDCYADGTTNVEVFRSDGSIRGAAAIEDLFRDFSD